MTIRRCIAVVAGSMLVLSPHIVGAQADLAVDAGSLPAGAVDCFQYYEFGSVQADLSTAVSGAVSGVPITFSGMLKNANPYPVVDGALYIKVFKVRSGNDGNGPDVVDEFLVRDGIAIPGNGSTPISFSWNVPSHAQSGQYELATFFITSHKFNLLGLTFTDDVVGNTVPFNVNGDQVSGIAFDKAGVTVDGNPYFFAAFPPSVGGSGPVTVAATVHNTTDKDASAEVEWTVYQWDAQLAENVVARERSTVTVPAGGSAPVSIRVTDARHPVYLVRGSLAWEDTKSIIGVRFARRDVNRLRINFPSLMSFPLKKGEKATLFSCLHNAGVADIIRNGELDLTLSNASGKIIHEYSYKGDVTGEMMGVADSFVPARDYDVLTLDARLLHNGALVDSARVTYDCNEIDPGLCKKGSLPNVLGSPAGISVIALASILAVLALFSLYRRAHKSEGADGLPTAQ